MRFEKWHALGNSYLVVEQPDAGALTADRVRRVCDVKTGIGSDGVLEIAHRHASSAQVVVWNPDGSVAEISGNGLRIAAAWLGHVASASAVTLDTGGRSVTARLVDDGVVELNMGDVIVSGAEMIDVAGESLELSAAAVGNPHAVVRRDSLSRDDLLRLGPAIETSPRFPERTNVQLVRVLDQHELEVLVWERGAGETTASGSSAVAAAAVASARGWCGDTVRVRMPGGELSVRLDGSEATLVGPVERVASGVTAF